MDDEGIQPFLDRIQSYESPEMREEAPLYSQQSFHEPSDQSPHSFLKAFNPYEASEGLPKRQRQNYLKMMQSSKFRPGLIHFFNLEQQENHMPEFLEDMNREMFEREEQLDKSLHLDDFFEPVKHDESQKINQAYNSLEKTLEKIQKKTLNSLHLHKCISSQFYERFDNFIYLHGEKNFLKDFEIALMNFLHETRKHRNPGPQLFVLTYQFWLKSLSSFIQEIFKYNEKFTLNFLKKKHGEESYSNYEARESCQESAIRSTSSKINQKRRPWRNSELEALEKLIYSDPAIRASSINKLSEELQRSVASISSKLQKIMKSRKSSSAAIDDGMTLSQKISQVLKTYPQGLQKDSIIERINEYYEMGMDDSWSKSVGQILSSRPEFVKVKGVYSIIGSYCFDIDKKAFKDKVINCLIRCPNQKGDIKMILQKYVEIYGEMEGTPILSAERKTAIQASISKSLSRYDVFDKSNSKTVYKLREYAITDSFADQIESYIC